MEEDMKFLEGLAANMNELKAGQERSEKMHADLKIGQEQMQAELKAELTEKVEKLQEQLAGQERMKVKFKEEIKANYERMGADLVKKMKACQKEMKAFMEETRSGQEQFAKEILADEEVKNGQLRQSEEENERKTGQRETNSKTDCVQERNERMEDNVQGENVEVKEDVKEKILEEKEDSQKKILQGDEIFQQIEERLKFLEKRSAVSPASTEFSCACLLLGYLTSDALILRTVYEPEFGESAANNEWTDLLRACQSVAALHVSASEVFRGLSEDRLADLLTIDKVLEFIWKRPDDLLTDCGNVVKIEIPYCDASTYWKYRRKGHFQNEFPIVTDIYRK